MVRDADLCCASRDKVYIHELIPVKTLEKIKFGDKRFFIEPATTRQREGEGESREGGGERGRAGRG